MAFDASREDYLRLSISFDRSLQGSDPYSAARAMMGFDHRFDSNRDELPQSDADRAFHLVAKATELLDYQLPFADDEEAGLLRDEADEALGEAIGLDADCHDAKRMRALLRLGHFDEAYHYLSDGAEEVRASCERTRASGSWPTADDASVAIRPYLRWEASLVTCALNSGRYRRAIEVALALLDYDPIDMADVRLSCALAYAKLEDEPGLEALTERCRPLTMLRQAPDPWMLLARMGLAYKRRDLEEARRLVRVMLDSFPHAALTLARQDELPDGYFSRIVVPVGSEDELILATSEGSVLLQEGRETNYRGPMGAWVAALQEVAAGAAADAAEIAGGDTSGAKGRPGQGGPSGADGGKGGDA